MPSVPALILRQKPNRAYVPLTAVVPFKASLEARLVGRLLLPQRAMTTPDRRKTGKLILKVAFPRKLSEKQSNEPLIEIAVNSERGKSSQLERGALRGNACSIMISKTLAARWNGRFPFQGAWLRLYLRFWLCCLWLRCSCPPSAGCWARRKANPQRHLFGPSPLFTPKMNPSFRLASHRQLFFGATDWLPIGRLMLPCQATPRRFTLSPKASECTSDRSTRIA